jgi:hypothetical protein
MRAVRMGAPSVARANVTEVPHQGRPLVGTLQSTCQRRTRQATKGIACYFCKNLKNKVLHYGNGACRVGSQLPLPMTIAAYILREDFYHRLPNAWKHRVSQPS